MDISEDILLNFYREMLKIRYFEEGAIRLWDQGKIKGAIHPYIGQEAIAVGVCQALRKEDYIVSSHRGHGHYIAKGGNPSKMLAELLGKSTGCCKGRGGSMHVADIETRNLGANAIVAGGLGIGVGAALTSKLKKFGYVVVAFFGEGATAQGMFHESLNMSAIWKLPIVFVCENNKYAVSTNCKESLPVEDVAQRTKAYNIPGVIVDGNDVLSVHKTAKEYIKRAINGKGPALIECKTYRWEGHYHGEPQVYRTKSELEKWKKRCPILRFERYLLDKKIEQTKLDNIKDSIKNEVKEAIDFAESSADPIGETVFEYLYSD
ncbi:Acetoin:2,6-dichlorophenolindophenol oxidoreductase subunit alpha [subsurface metagenome]